MVIDYNIARDIADYLLTTCTRAHTYRGLWRMSAIDQSDIDEIDREQLLLRYGNRKSCQMALDDHAYNDALMQPWELACDAKEPARFRKKLANAFLSLIWEDISACFANAVAQWDADQIENRLVDEALDRRLGV